jgi:23S rRNA (guanosine2251-2'-O)-methyltransferase
MKASLAQGHYLIYGKHAVEAALANPKRVKRQLFATRNAMDKLAQHSTPKLRRNLVESQQLESLLPTQAVHQGLALEVQPLPQPDLEEVAELGKPLIMLDQVSDPHNIGAIMRSAAAFGASAIICQDKHAPKENATISKIAAGALETIALIRVTNLARTLEELQNHHYWSIGMDGSAELTLGELNPSQKTVLVMGAEGRGLRPLVAKHCDQIAKLPIQPEMESLNVSVAAGIGLYEISRS